MLSCYCVCVCACVLRCAAEITRGRSWADSLCDLQALQGSELSSRLDLFGVAMGSSSRSCVSMRSYWACGCHNRTRENVKEGSPGKHQNDSEGKGCIAWSPFHSFPFFLQPWCTARYFLHADRPKEAQDIKEMLGKVSRAGRGLWRLMLWFVFTPAILILYIVYSKSSLSWFLSGDW